ncbi:DMT family transporter [Lachnospiraceae bacterium NSJ-143]|nr:DMT family transporter [Lachnospiraceae bacterium NSJ-143]
MTKKNKAIMFIITAAFFFTIMNICVRLSGDIPVMEKSFFRNFVAFIVAGFVLVREKCPPFPNREAMPPLFLRAAFGTCGILGNFYAVDHLMLADATMLNKLSPFFVIIFSFFILKERVNIIQALGVVAAFVGALFIIKPGVGLSSQVFASLIGFLGGLGAGVAYTMVRLCNQRGAKGPQIVFFFSGFSCLVVLPYIIFFYHPMTLVQVLTLIAAGASAACAQFAVTAAYSNAPAKEISIYDYSQLIFAAVLGFFIFGNIPDTLSIIGYFIISGASAAMFVYNNRHNGKRSSEASEA